MPELKHPLAMMMRDIYHVQMHARRMDMARDLMSESAGDVCDREPILSPDDVMREADAMAIQREVDAAEQSVIEEAIRERKEWLEVFQDRHGAVLS